VGAGPFTVESYFRDDRLTLVRNPDWFDAPLPYLDSVTYRVVSDEQQRLDTFAAGDANMLQSISIGFLDQAREAGGEYTTVDVSSGQALLYNVVAPPFDDVRLRQAVALAVDRDVLAEIISGEGAVGATNFTPESSPWFSAEGALPTVDLDAAQALVDEAVADNGGPVSFTLGGFQVSSGPLATEFIQTSLNQLDGLEVEVELLDAPTAISRVFAGDFQMWMFGQPFLDPEPSLYGYVHTDAGQNHASYSNATVDAALDEGRLTADQTERQSHYATVFGELANDLPWMPILHPTQGVAFDSSVHGVELIWDGIVRFDLVWRD
jgi:peptide/nickel transport system substrate-binding protein